MDTFRKSLWIKEAQLGKKCKLGGECIETGELEQRTVTEWEVDNEM